MRKSELFNWSRTQRVLKYMYQNKQELFYKQIDLHYFKKNRIYCFFQWIPYIKYSAEVMWILYKKWFLYKYYIWNKRYFGISKKWIEYWHNYF